MTPDYLAEIPPILRGLSFDGKKGCLVSLDAGNSGRVPESDGKKELSVSLTNISAEDENSRIRLLVEELTQAWITWQTSVGDLQRGTGAVIPFPSRVTVDEVGTFLLRRDDGSGNPVSGKVAVVTGGAQGFGEGIVREFIAEGAFVWIADMNEEGARGLSDELNAKAGKTVSLPVKVDVSDESSVWEMVRTIVSGTGGIDIFVNNAGVLKAGSVKTMELSAFRFVTDVNYVGYFLCAKYVSRVMALQNQAFEAFRKITGGKKTGSSDAPNAAAEMGVYFTDIIQINSKSGLEGSNKNGAYAGGKFGGLGLTQSFALELVEDNIKVNAVCPGNFFDGPLWSDPEKGLFVQYLKTGKVPGAKTMDDVKVFYEAKVPMKRGCRVADVVKAMRYIIDQQYETGQAVPVTGGQIMLK